MSTDSANARSSQESASRNGRRDALLDELRALARTYPDDAALRDRLARSLFNSLYQNAHPDSLLDELRALVRDYPDDAGVRKRLLTLQNS
jgi:hypothetical protein